MARYIIMSKTVSKDGEHQEGYLIQNFLASFWQPGTTIKFDDYSILVFEDLVDAENYLAYLRDAYKYEFKQRAKRLKVPYSDFGFWLKKLDSSTTPLFITEDRTKRLRPDFQKKYPSVKYYGFKPKEDFMMIVKKEPQKS